ncbi:MULTISPECIES: TetR/AcrR family transcriptional regulator C-terminal domain-containing protein [unclassified Streptomyces]|uniref:TetR/AcrR family transcriptional regulator C-terminal domain-containing protein n=1 Tax=unclassified Streptomyces TaxID=2593676 RepID=UPI00109E5108|nr:TetR/AcrR family transcriptional regulator C-terminal domain-containing protein [Streptomyces sp. A1136]THA56806.1 TetR/AcrR family transcriptional regulator [Streptomyces sp. A1136]
MPRRSAALDRATPGAIAEAALAILDEEGPGALSFRALADRLDVSHATVQRRCVDLAGLLDLCTEHLAARLPEIPATADWAEATELRFRALYRLLVAHPGLLVLRGGRPWLGRELLARLVEPALADSVAAGMSAAEAMTAYRRMYLLTLGSAAFVDHRDPAGATARSRAALAALDPSEFPVLSAGIAAVLPALTDHEVYYGALRQLIEAARPTAA